MSAFGASLGDQVEDRELAWRQRADVAQADQVPARRQERVDRVHDLLQPRSSPVRA